MAASQARRAAEAAAKGLWLQYISDARNAHALAAPTHTAPFATTNDVERAAQEALQAWSTLETSLCASEGSVFEAEAVAADVCKGGRWALGTASISALASALVAARLEAALLRGQPPLDLQSTLYQLAVIAHQGLSSDDGMIPCFYMYAAGHLQTLSAVQDPLLQRFSVSFVCFLIMYLKMRMWAQ